MAVDVNALRGDKKIPSGILFKRSISYMKGEYLSFLLAILFVIANVGIEVALPTIIEEITNRLRIPTFDYRIILLFALGHFGLTIISQAFLFVESMILQKAGQRVVYKLRMEVFEHIENMSLDQFNEMPVGSLVTRVANYTSNMSDLFSNVLINLLRNTLTIIGVFFVMLVKSAPLTGFLSIFMVVILVVSYFFRKIVRKIFTQERADLSDLNTFLNENLSGMKIIQIFNQQERKDKEFMVKNNKLLKTKFKVIIAFALYRPFVTFLYYAAMALTFYVGMQNALLPGTVLAFYLYISRFFNPIQNIADQLNAIQRAMTSCERLFNLLDIQPEVLDRPNAIDVDSFEGRIEFKNVWFAYKDDEWILKDVSFVVEPKQTVAFVGATGAGKTTILSLIVRNYEIQKGQILIDGIDIRDIKIKSLRKGIGQMLQDVFLFSGNIRNNITLHDDSFKDEEILDTCKYVGADTIINNSANGLDEEVIERGENLSGGQKQLISFARTVLHKPQILILDEATANIDTETEVLIQESLEKMKNIGTMLVVAHRLSTIQKADQIIVLQKGEIIERGNHQQLLKNHSYYYKLYKLQFEN